jgi:hypothetical protein
MTKKTPDLSPHPASFRDPSGFIFRRDNLFYRQVNLSYQKEYDQLISSGLYKELTGKKLLIAHSEVSAGEFAADADRYKVLFPEQLAFISYPWEWSPAQLSDAALLTLDILQRAISHDMILKDATPLNIQFAGGRPVFIDSLSFDRYDPSRPWVAYRQFCECFLLPLYLHHYLQAGVHTILRAYPEGIPAALAKRMLPWKSRMRLGVWLHVILPAQVRTDRPAAGQSFSRKKMTQLVSHLRSCIENLDKPIKIATHWSRYYEDTIMSVAYLREKEKLVREITTGIEFPSALDLGANDGYFAKLLAQRGIPVVAADADWLCIDNLYRWTREGSSGILPLCIDLADPTPASGFEHTERSSFTERMEAGLVMALAVLHHLTIGRSLPLHRIAAWFSRLAGPWLLVEYIPPTDKKALELIQHKRGIFHPYDQEAFESVFSRYFAVEKKLPVPETERVLYLMRRKNEYL